MPSPFPGMDPYLEKPSLWPGVHHGLISLIQEKLNPQVLPKYIVQIETRVYVLRDEDPANRQFVADVSVEATNSTNSGRPRENEPSVLVVEPIVIPFLIEPEVEEARLEIKDRRSHALITVIEVLSPSNKIRDSEGRESFMAKRREIMAADVHWVEIDLLRNGAPSIVPMLPPSDYRIFLSRAHDRRRTLYWPIGLRQKLPIIGIPLKGADPDVPLDLNAVLNDVYNRAAYSYLVDYGQPPEPPLSTADSKWANKLLRAKGVR